MVRIHVRPIASRRTFRRLTGFGAVHRPHVSERFTARWFFQTLASVTVCVGDVAQLGERWLCKPEVAGSIPVVSNSKALLANTAGKAFLLDFRRFASVARLAIRSSPSTDETTPNDTDCPDLPEFGTSLGTSEVTACLGEFVESWSPVPVARIVVRSVERGGGKSSDGSVSNAP